jgi:hypothetical protein
VLGQLNTGGRRVQITRTYGATIHHEPQEAMVGKKGKASICWKKKKKFYFQKGGI